VHLEDYPEADEALIDPDLEQSMAVVRRVVALGRGLRVAEGVRIRQPLARLTVVSHDQAVRTAVEAHAALVAEELNVGDVITSAAESGFATVSAKPDFARLGPRFGPRMKDAAAAIAALGEAAVLGVLEGGSVEVMGEEVTADDLVVARQPLPGVAVASDDLLSVALDTTLTPQLEREGLAREVVKLVQGLRRDAGLEVSDRITLRWSSDAPEMRAVFAEHGGWIAGEVLAESVVEGAGDAFDAAGVAVNLSVVAVPN
jgi:isoleucyl-tRNA synthetase